MHAAILHARGVDALVSKRFSAARRLLERARCEANEQDLLARIEVSLAFLALETGNLPEALGLADGALEHRDLAEETKGVVQGQRALILMRLGHVSAALVAFADAVAAIQEPGQLAKALNNRGGVFLQQGDPLAAARDFSAAVPQFLLAGSPIEAAMAKHNLGYCRLLTGDLVGALAAMDEARTALASLSPMAQATCDQDRAEVLMAAGQIEEGRTALREAARAYGARRMHQRRGESELALALAQTLSDPGAALLAARRARRSFQRAHVEAWRIRADAAAFVAEVEMGRTAASLVLRGEALATELDAQGLRWRALNVRLRVVRVMIRRGDLRAASERLRELRTNGKAPLASRMLHRDVRAEFAAAQGRRTDALEHVRRGLLELHAWQSSFGSLDLQTGVVSHGVRLATRGLVLAVESRRPAVLFEWSERARMLASRVQPVRAPEDERIVADLAELRGMSSERSSRDAAREAQLRRRVRERAWRHRGSGEVADPISLVELRSRLDADTALIAYVVTRDRMVALVVTADTTSWVDLGERPVLETLLGGLLPDLDVAAAELAEPMAGFVRTALAERLTAVARLLVEPVLEAVGDRCVVLTPSGVLAGVPWTLLPGFTGRPVTVAQSATSWLSRRTTPLRPSSAGFVAGPQVARAEDEVLAAAKEWPTATVLVGGDANAVAVSELAGSVDVLHLAAHGRHSAENPLFSGLQLLDGPWFGYDIDQLRSVPDVVVLSACEVGRSTVRWGEELIGMATAWLHAGAKCVIASPAAVNDGAAYDVLVAVHQQLAAGADPAAALASAVPAVSADSPPVPLICFG